MKRIFDLIFALTGMLFLVPVFIIISIIIKLDTRGPVLYRQKRVGKLNKDFNLLKFRSMDTGADKRGLLTIGSRDNRITKTGYYLRKYKVDELPQLWNVFIGDMSLVGPRPEVRKYVELYNLEQQKVLSIKPGLTDYASLEFINENELLRTSDHPETLYTTEIMPTKLRLNLHYINTRSFLMDLTIIIKTLLAIFRKHN